MASDTVWTEDRIQQAADLYNVGLSASHIAHIMGEDFSRNSVIGMLNRLGFKAKDRPAVEMPREKWRPSKHAHVNKITLPEIKVHVHLPAKPVCSGEAA